MPSLPPYRPPREQPEPAFHVAEMMLPQNPKPVAPHHRLKVQIDQVQLPASFDGDFPLVGSSLLLPSSVRPRDWTMAPGPGGFEVPWEAHPKLASILIPGPAAQELRWRERWRFEYHLTPACVGLDFSEQALVEAAWAALSRVPDLAEAIGEVAILTELVDAAGYGSDHEATFLARMDLPKDITQRLAAEMSPRRPLLDPRCLRWIVAEMCVALAHSRPRRRKRLSAEAETVARLFLPLSAGSGVVLAREVYRALWFLHAGFELGARDERAEDDALPVLAMTSAYAAGIRLFGEPEDCLARASEMWSLDDRDPFLTGRDVVPSEVRGAFAQKAGLDISTFLALVGVMQLAMRAGHLGVEHARDALWRVVQRFPLQDRRAFVSVVRRHLTLDPRRLGKRILDEMRRYKLPYEGFGTVPRHATEAMRDHPFLDLDGEPRPLGIALFVDRASELPAVFYAQRAGISRREAAGRVGHLFEAQMHHRLARIRARHWVANEQDIDRVAVDEEQRPDALIGSGSRRYLAVEFNASRLQTGVLAANTKSVEDRVEAYLAKRRQADALVANAPRIIGELRGSAVLASVDPLLVVDEPLQVNPAFEQVIEKVSPGTNPRFVCSVDEFELLLELGEAGWDIPQAVENWQKDGRGQMLGTALMKQLKLTPGARRRPERLAQLVQSIMDDLAA